MAKELVLALGGGGVRGIAHLGVLQCLEDYHYTIKAIAGTSAGGLFGAPYAAGNDLQTIRQVVSEFMLKPSFKRSATDRSSLIGTTGLAAALQPLIGEKNIEDFPIPFAVTAVSLKTGQEIVLTEGNAMKAILATIAVPGIFPMMGDEDEMLVDGGVMDPVPISTARKFDTSLPVVAVVLHRKPSNFSPAEVRLPMADALPQNIIKRVSQTRLGAALQVLYSSIEVITDRMAEMNVTINKPDVLVAPPIGHINMLENTDAKMLMDEGYRAMEAEISTLEDSCNLVNTFKRITRYTEAKK